MKHQDIAEIVKKVCGEQQEITLEEYIAALDIVMKFKVQEYLKQGVDISEDWP